MEDNSFFDYIKDTLSMFWEDFVYFLSGVAGSILMLLFGIDFILIVACPFISVFYWVGIRVISSIPVSMGSWLFPVIWIVSGIIMLLAIAGMAYYDDRHPSPPGPKELRGWPD